MSDTEDLDDSIILLSSGFDRDIRLWDISKGYCKDMQTIPKEHIIVNCLAINTEKHIFAAGTSSAVLIYSLQSKSEFFGNLLCVLDGFTSTNILCVGFRDYLLYCGTEDGGTFIWNCSNLCNLPLSIVSTNKFKHSINTIALHPNKKEMFIGDSDGVIIQLDIVNNSIICSIKPSGKHGQDYSIHSIDINQFASMLACVSSSPVSLGASEVMLSYLPLAHIFEFVAESIFILRGAKIAYSSGDITKFVDDEK
ncbi:hypothetical protein GJ496_000145 [Pomphorhynchus laevis]|nr:hypothetical protein GJ496_000145 [Pomphorhynchus laevis]